MIAIVKGFLAMEPGEEMIYSVGKGMVDADCVIMAFGFRPSPHFPFISSIFQADKSLECSTRCGTAR